MHESAPPSDMAKWSPSWRHFMAYLKFALISMVSSSSQNSPYCDVIFICRNESSISFVVSMSSSTLSSSSNRSETAMFWIRVSAAIVWRTSAGGLLREGYCFPIGAPFSLLLSFEFFSSRISCLMRTICFFIVSSRRIHSGVGILRLTRPGSFLNKAYTERRASYSGCSLNSEVYRSVKA